MGGCRGSLACLCLPRGLLLSACCFLARPGLVSWVILIDLNYQMFILRRVVPVSLVLVSDHCVWVGLMRRRRSSRAFVSLARGGGGSISLILSSLFTAYPPSAQVCSCQLVRPQALPCGMEGIPGGASPRELASHSRRGKGARTREMASSHPCYGENIEILLHEEGKTGIESGFEPPVKAQPHTIVTRIF